MSTPSTTSFQYGPSLLSLDKSTLYAAAFISLLVVETFSGALRFYLSQAGLAWLLYLPKVACLAMVGFELLTLKGPRGFWLALLTILTSSQLALLHGASVANIGFSVFVIAPLLFGLVCGSHLERRSRLLVQVVGLCLAASLAGVLLDKFTDVPWKGYSYMVGETEVSGNRAWASGDLDRIAGFARMSTTLAVMLAVYSLFVAAFTTSRLVRWLLYGVTLAALLATTNKSSLVAYAITLLAMFVVAYRLPSATLSLVVVLAGVALPVASLTVNIDPATVSGASDQVNASFNDRLANSWPNFIAVIVDQGWHWWGAGFGAVGSSGASFPIVGLDLLIVADNTALYLWGAFGVFGLLLYLLLFPLLLRLHERGSPLRFALFGIVLCIGLVAWATDVLEVPVAGLFLGLSIAQALSPTRGMLPLSATARRPRVRA